MTIAQRFFDERVVGVSGSNAEDFYRNLDQVLSDAPLLHEEGLNDVLNRSGVAPDVAFFFRGQTDARHGLNSSLYRQLRPHLHAGPQARYVEKEMARVEQQVLSHARKDQGIGRNLTDRELLSVLQHHGAPTRLIDVTLSWKVALYFAAETDDSTDGRLFAFGFRPRLWARLQRQGTSGLWPDTEEHPWQKTVWPMLLPFTDPRMIAQQGYFLVGGLATNSGSHNQYWRGSTARPEQEQKALTQTELREVSTLMIRFPANVANPIRSLGEALTGTWTASGCSILVPAGMKRELRLLLRDDGIHPDSIYPPIDESVRSLRHVAQVAAARESLTN